MGDLDYEQLIELERAIREKLIEILTLKNRDGTLKQFMSDIGMSTLLADMLSQNVRLETWREGRILIVGAPQRMEKDLRGAAKTMGINPERLDFITYDETTNYAFRNLENSPKWCAVLFGAGPHSARDMGKDSSILIHLEKNRDRFPETRRLTAGQRLKVTKTNFKDELAKLIEEGQVAVDKAFRE